MNASQSACLVLHGKAAMREDVRAAVRAVRDEGCRVEVHVTWERGDAGRFARQAADAGFGVVVAGGYQLCPEALLDDALLDVRVLPQLPSEEIPETLSALLREGLDALRRTLVNARVSPGWRSRRRSPCKSTGTASR